MYRPFSLTIPVNCLVRNVESGYVSILYTYAISSHAASPEWLVTEDTGRKGKERRTDWHVVILLLIVGYVVLALK